MPGSTSKPGLCHPLHPCPRRSRQGECQQRTLAGEDIHDQRRRVHNRPHSRRRGLGALTPTPSHRATRARDARKLGNWIRFESRPGQLDLFTDRIRVLFNETTTGRAAVRVGCARRREHGKLVEHRRCGHPTLPSPARPLAADCPLKRAHSITMD